MIVPRLEGLCSVASISTRDEDTFGASFLKKCKHEKNTSTSAVMSLGEVAPPASDDNNASHTQNGNKCRCACTLADGIGKETRMDLNAVMSCSSSSPTYRTR